MQKDNSGSTPVPDMLTERKKQIQLLLWNIGTDAPDATHGTHVAGICAGSGFVPTVNEVLQVESKQHT